MANRVLKTFTVVIETGAPAFDARSENLMMRLVEVIVKWCMFNLKVMPYGAAYDRLTGDVHITVDSNEDAQSIRKNADRIRKEWDENGRRSVN